jgi:hypothetical protein
MCFIARGSRKIVRKIKVDKGKLEQIAHILEVDETLLSRGKLVGIEFLYEEGAADAPDQKKGSKSASKKSR